MRRLGSVAAVMLATVCVGGVAKADIQRTFEGRWIANNQSLTLDLSRCGNGWCGIEVTKAGSCGRTVLRVTEGSPDDGGALYGRLELATHTQPYTIAMHLFRRNPNDPETLMIRGNTGTRFDAWRRMYPYMVAFSRVSDVTCWPEVS
jgi:hypothetical protein